MNKAVPYNLYVIISSHLTKGRNPLDVARAAIAGGADVIQLREKKLPVKEQVQLAAKLQDLCETENVTFIVNDRLDVALAVNAHGVHLGQDDLPPQYAKQLMPREMILGVSTHSLAQARAAEDLGADYIGFGPIFSTNSKSDTDPVVGVKQLGQVVASVSLPVVAIGGINETNVDQIVSVGGSNIAVISAVAQADDIAKAAQKLRAQLVRG